MRSLYYKHYFLHRALLLVGIFVFPWTVLGLYELELRIKELYIITGFLFIVGGCLLNNKPFLIGESGRYYGYFVILCILHYFYFAITSIDARELSFVTHILLMTLLNLVVYLVFLNTSVQAKGLTDGTKELGYGEI